MAGVSKVGPQVLYESQTLGWIEALAVCKSPKTLAWLAGTQVQVLDTGVSSLLPHGLHEVLHLHCVHKLHSYGKH